jgi:drug/metabolite transporter (DMT)-like permease
MPFVGELSALLTACFWAGSALVFAAATARAGSMPVNLARLLLATLYLGVLIALMGFSVHISFSQGVLLCISGVIGLAIGDSFLFNAFRELGPRITMLIMSTAPAFAALLAFILLHETLSFYGILGILVTLGGVAMVVLERNPNAPRVPVAWRGVFFAAIAAAGQGVGLIFAKMAFLEGEINGFVATLIRILGSLVIMLPIGVAAARSSNAFRILLTDRRAFVLTAIGAVLGPFLGISFSLIAVAHTSVGIAATIMATVPIIMLPLVHFIHREQLTWKAMLGAVIAVAGVAVLFLR